MESQFLSISKRDLRSPFLHRSRKFQKRTIDTSYFDAEKSRLDATELQKDPLHRVTEPRGFSYGAGASELSLETNVWN